jgi:hypothetical protein
MPLLRFESFEVSLAGPEIIEASFSAKAKYSNDSASAILFTLVNTQEGYLIPNIV